MLFCRVLRRILPYLAFGSLVAFASSSASDAVPDNSPTWLQTLWNLPVIGRYLAPAPVVQPPACSVDPLPGIVDAEALVFEREQGPDITGLAPAMARALEKFRKLVTSAGGTFELKSAYRPGAYQEHLQEVWFKWMRELRHNHESGCQALRALVNDEFTRHHLMETQMPVTSSDHTRGMAFDAAVMIPRATRKKTVRVSLDRLALRAGLKRPDIRHDPVHFKLVIGRGA